MRGFAEAFASVDAQAILTGLAVLLAVLLATGGIIGQVRKGVVQELREALKQARDEIDIAHGIVERLTEEMRVLAHRIEVVEVENRVLSAAMVSGKIIAPEFAKLLDGTEQRLSATMRELLTEAK